MPDYLGMQAPERNEARAEFLGRFSEERQPGEYKGGRISPVKRYAGIIGDAERIIADKLPDILENALKLATGTATEEVALQSGKVVERRLPPDTKMIQYLIDRLAGKPVTPMQMEVNGEVKHNGLVIHLTPQAPAEVGDISPQAQLPAPVELPGAMSVAIPEPLFTQVKRIGSAKRRRAAKAKVVVEEPVNE